MRKIFKYPVPLRRLTSEVTLQVPAGAKFISVQNQSEQLCFWFDVDPGDGRVQESRHFYVRGTGHALSGSEGLFLGTVQFMQGELVFHIFSKS